MLGSLNGTRSMTSATAAGNSWWSKSRFASKTSCAVTAGRLLFILCLVASAAILGYLAHAITSQSETTLAEHRFRSIADRALVTSQQIVARKKDGAISMASVAGAANPDVEKWPFVHVHQFDVISTNLIKTSNGREMGFAPIVQSSLLSMYEEFAYKYYQSERVPPLPNGTGCSSFGKGIWRPDPTSDTPDKRVHVTDGKAFNSSNDIVVPILQHNAGQHPVLMINLRFEPIRTKAIDDIIACSANRMNNNDADEQECGVLTDMTYLTSQEEEEGPSALLIQPIYTSLNVSSLAGLIPTTIVWDEALQNVFASDVNGVDCVLRTANEVFTYGVSDGVPFVRGKGDLHEKKYEQYGASVVLTKEGLFSSTSATYTLELYPTADFFSTYSTKNPMIATVGAVGIIVLTSVLFFLYDFFVRIESDARKQLLEAKRMFVRFVSHEVRTPLNTATMGLTLLLEEIRMNLPTASQKPDLSPDGVITISEKTANDWVSLSQQSLCSSQIAVDVLSDLLNYDKIEFGTLSLELSLIPIHDLVERTVAEFHLMALERKVCLSLEFRDPKHDTKLDPEEAQPPGTHDQVVGDPIRLTQVLRNTISNGLKFTPEGGSLSVTVSSNAVMSATKLEVEEFRLANGVTVKLRRAGQVIIVVKDSGVGMTEAQVRDVFGQGVQFNVNTLQSGRGSGLGMYIAKGIVEQHNGTLEASSEGLGKGASFTSTLPRYQFVDAASAQYSDQNDTQESRPPQETYETHPLHILVVDDSAPNRKLLVRMLQNRGHRCSEAKDGGEAIQVANESTEKNDPHDCVLLDYEMPVMNGPTACKRIREAGSSAFIVGVTGNVMPEDVSYFKECGANAVLPKPFKLASLEQLWMEYGVSGHSQAGFRESN